MYLGRPGLNEATIDKESNFQILAQHEDPDTFEANIQMHNIIYYRWC